MSVDEVMKPILSYRPFYDASEKGGVTLSGGEPTFQPQFTLALLKRCANFGIHTAIETCGYTQFNILESLIDYADLLLYDLKHMNDELHRKATGVSNRPILKNLKKIASETDVECVVRVPLICGFNDNEKNIKETLSFVSALGIKQLDLLPFNELPSGKYKSLGLIWEYERVQRQSNKRLAELQEIVKEYGLKVTIGGMW